MKHLPVAVLVDDVDALVRGDEVVHLGGERIGPQPQVVGLDAVLALQLVERLDQRVMRGAVGDDADFVALVAHHLRLGHQRARVFELAAQAVQVVHVVVGTLAVLAHFSLCPLPRANHAALRMIGARQRAIADAVAVHVFVARESAQAVEVFLVSTLPRLIGSSGYSNGSDIQLFMPRSRSVMTNTGVCNCSARSKASLAMLKHSATEHGISMGCLVSPCES